MQERAISLQELSDKTGISERTIRRRLKGQKLQTLLFSGAWRAIDTNPEGIRRQWIFEKVQPEAVAA